MRRACLGLPALLLACGPPTPESLCRRALKVAETPESAEDAERAACIEALTELQQRDASMFQRVSGCIKEATSGSDIRGCMTAVAYAKELREAPPPDLEKEARETLAEMYDLVLARFAEPWPVEGPDAPRHRCPADRRDVGAVGPTPRMDLDCNLDPVDRCLPVKQVQLQGQYPRTRWTADPVWRGMQFERTKSHDYHYAYRWATAPKGYGSCQFTVMAFGDLDGDGTFSTFERVGSVDESGVAPPVDRKDGGPWSLDP